MKTTEVETRYDERIGMYIAVAPEQDYCTAFGRTLEEARARLELAVALWLDTAGGPGSGSESGEPPPRSD